MEGTIFYLVYVSAATALCTDSELLSLLDAARKNNSNREITGLLLYYEGSFIEILEGRQETVEWLFDEKIRLDKRHHNITRLISGFEPRRSFPQWSMGFRRVEKELMNEHVPHFNTILETHSNLQTTFPELHKPLLVFLRSFYRSSGYSARE
jgi:hypothetical protein